MTSNTNDGFLRLYVENDQLSDAPRSCLQNVPAIFSFSFPSCEQSNFGAEQREICVEPRAGWSGAVWRGVEHWSAHYGSTSCER